jgi:NhaP-type Na+/H+ and K+/H+ antiporter
MYQVHRSVTILFGFLALALGLLGLLVGDKQLFGFLNVDLALDVARLALAALLLYAAFGARTDSFMRSSLMVFGVVYVALALVGLASPTIGGLLPHGLSTFDKLFHALAGIFTIAVAARHESSAVSHA